MNATQLLHDLGQSLWLDNITRDLLDNGTLQQERRLGEGQLGS
jgi:transaldolase